MHSPYLADRKKPLLQEYKEIELEEIKNKKPDNIAIAMDELEQPSAKPIHTKKQTELRALLNQLKAVNEGIDLLEQIPANPTLLQRRRKFNCFTLLLVLIVLILTGDGLRRGYREGFEGSPAGELFGAGIVFLVVLAWIIHYRFMMRHNGNWCYETYDQAAPENLRTPDETASGINALEPFTTLRLKQIAIDAGIKLDERKGFLAYHATLSNLLSEFKKIKNWVEHSQIYIEYIENKSSVATFLHGRIKRNKNSPLYASFFNHTLFEKHLLPEIAEYVTGLRP